MQPGTPPLAGIPHKHIFISIQHFDTFISVVAEESTFGIGEIGLDCFQIDNKPHQQKQQDLLRKLVDFVHTSELPVIIHCLSSEVPDDEDAMQDCIQILASCLEKCYQVYSIVLMVAYRSMRCS